MKDVKKIEDAKKCRLRFSKSRLEERRSRSSEYFMYCLCRRRRHVGKVERKALLTP